MGKVYFEDDEEFFVFMGDCFVYTKTEGSDNYHKSIHETWLNAKEKGYIKKSISEEAEAMYNKYILDGKYTQPEHIVITTLYKALKQKLSEVGK